MTIPTVLLLYRGERRYGKRYGKYDYLLDYLLELCLYTSIATEGFKINIFINGLRV